MSRNICQGDTEKYFLNLTEEYQTERIFVGKGRKIEVSLVFMKDSSVEKHSRLLKVDHLVLLKLFMS